MPTHIGFLRAVNIGKRPYKTADLRAALTAAGYDDVDTYIQTGNVRITSPLRSRAKVEAELEAVFLADRGFQVSTIVLSPTELTAVARDAAELAEADPPRHGHSVSLLKVAPTAEGVAAIEARSTDDERLVVRGRAVHMLSHVPFNEARTTNTQVEKALGIATARNMTVIRALVERWC